MKTYRIIQRIDTYATTEVQAEDIGLALEQVANDDGDLAWDYDTDYDSAKTITWDLLADDPDPDYLGVTFVDPYLGRDDVVWEVDAMMGDGDVQAQIIASDDDDDLGTQDIYSIDFVEQNRIVR